MATYRTEPQGKQRLLLRSICGLIAIALISGGDRLMASYKYYSRIIDARLASGYLTSRPGLYAAPRTFRVGQKISRADLIIALRRAGLREVGRRCYLERKFSRNTIAG